MALVVNGGQTHGRLPTLPGYLGWRRQQFSQETTLVTWLRKLVQQFFQYTFREYLTITAENLHFDISIFGKLNLPSFTRNTHQEHKIIFTIRSYVIIRLSPLQLVDKRENVHAHFLNRPSVNNFLMVLYPGFLASAALTISSHIL